MSAKKLIAAYQEGVCGNEQNIPSPCVSVCVMNPGKGQCSGCYRFIEEIAAWSRLSDADKKQVWVQLVQRAESESSP